MFPDYDKVKALLKNHFSEIIQLMDKRQLSYDEIKDLLVSALYDISLHKQEVKEEVYIYDQVLYGPPPMSEVKTIYVDIPSLDHSDEFVPGTNIYKPREKKVDETEEEYLAYLEKYYSAYFPDQKRHKAR